MKIVQKGLGYDAKAKWWAGKKLSCDRCGCLFELEAKDAVKVTDDQREGSFGQIKCPECLTVITFSLKRGYQGPG